MILHYVMFEGKQFENRPLMMKKMVVLSSFSLLSIMNVQLLSNYCGTNT